MKENKGLSIFKSGKTGSKKNTPDVNVENKKPLSREEERDQKAKQMVNDILKDVNLDPNKPDDLLVVEEDVTSKGDLTWLEEQVDLLTNKNNQLESELIKSKEEYEKLYTEFQFIRQGGGVVGDEFVKQKVIELFNEIQSNHIKLGTDPMSGVGNFRIYCPGFLNRLITFFPFLNEFKQY